MDTVFKIKSGLFGKFQMTEYEPTKKQRSVIESLRQNRFNIIRKSRQVGGTTLLAVEVANRMISDPMTNVGYVVPKLDNGRNFRSTIEDLLKQYDIEVTNNSYKHLKISNGSQLRIISSQENLKTNSFGWLIFDEAAFIKDIQYMWGLANLMSTDVEITMISTPTSNRTEFNELYLKALTKKNDFKIHDLMWYDHPTFGINVYWIRDGDRELKLYDNGDPDMIVRFTELGFERVSDTYLKHLDMYGYDTNKKRFEFQAHIV